MSDVQRYEPFLDRSNGIGVALRPFPFGDDEADELVVIKLADHVEALRQAESEIQQAFQHGLEVGQRDALARYVEWVDKRKTHDWRSCDDYDHDCYLCRAAVAVMEGQTMDAKPTDVLSDYAKGQRDALAGLDNAEVWGRIMQVLNDNGINTQGGSIHSWRCFDKERYPEPCSCAAELVVEIIAAIKEEPK